MWVFGGGVWVCEGGWRKALEEEWKKEWGKKHAREFSLTLEELVDQEKEVGALLARKEKLVKEIACGRKNIQETARVMGEGALVLYEKEVEAKHYAKKTLGNEVANDGVAVYATEKRDGSCAGPYQRGEGENHSCGRIGHACAPGPPEEILHQIGHSFLSVRSLLSGSHVVRPPLGVSCPSLQPCAGQGRI